MPLSLYGHPFSSYTQKVLIALFESAVPHALLSLDPAEPNHTQITADWLQRWPLRMFPVLVDADRSIIESSVIIEYLHLAYPGAVPLLPQDPMDALHVRFLDRFFDLHVMTPVQDAVGGALSGDDVKKQEAREKATEALELAYAWLDGHLATTRGLWAAGDHFTLADCAAAPALFYADWTHPIGASFPGVRAYRARLLERPSVARAVDGGRPFRHYFPLGAPDRD